MLEASGRSLDGKQACLFLLFAAFAALLLRGDLTSATFVGGWQQQNPKGDPTYLQLAHYAVSTQTANRTLYDTVFKLTAVATQVVAGVNYKLCFLTSPSNCTIGRDVYTAQQCVPSGPVNGFCTAIVYVVVWMNSTQVTNYTCAPPREAASC
ncbi:cystatin-2-like [Haemaphysalis longicornis]